MGLPLLFGIIAYLLIILFMSIWLTKYHTAHCWVSNHDHRVGEDEYHSNKRLNKETGKSSQDSQTTTLSGSQSSIPEQKEVLDGEDSGK